MIMKMATLMMTHDDENVVDNNDISDDKEL